MKHTKQREIREKCGVFGVYNSPTAAHDIYHGLFAQQHRGQEGAGIVVCNGSGEFYVHKDLGLVTQIFNDDVIENLHGRSGIGHVRYSTSGACGKKDLQPLVVTHRDRVISIAHNGNITNAATLKEGMEIDGSLFTTSSDTEVILHKIVGQPGGSLTEKIRAGLRDVEGAYSLVIQSDEGIAGVRDPYGFRPLFVGRRDDAWYFASETCAFDIVDAELICEIEPGEGYLASSQGLHRFRLEAEPCPHFCSFEVVYFSRPDSLYKGRSIHHHRLELGKALFEEHPTEADIVTAVPDSSNSAALGYALASGIPLDIGLIRSHFTGRTFISPDPALRDVKVRQKFNVVRDAIEGKRVVVVDDSIVRGTTSRKIVKLFRDKGAKEVHLRIGSPKVMHPCFYGIDMPDRGEFLINKIPESLLCTFLHVDSIGFLSTGKLASVVGSGACQACFTGKYPVPVEQVGTRIEKTNKVGNGEYAYL
jgi:amidophosphoribosyltransferase